ncbi:MAG: NADH-quinone oxidoreductase subunit NuoE [Thermodesulfobacteriota bacterium]
MLTEKVREEILNRTAKYYNKKSAVMDALMLVQKDCGNNLTRSDMEDIADLLEIKPHEVNAVASFYTMYNYAKPVGRYHIQVCRNLSCALLEAEAIIAHIEDSLGIKTGGTTPDNKFTLSTAECLGSCGTAPMMQINDDYYEDLTTEKVDAILAGLE